MRASRKLLPILLVVIFAALVVAACSGGGAAGQEKTWFNLPSTPLDIKSDGSASVYGLDLPIGALVPAATLQQLQAADAQRVEARVGANGIHVFVNGEQLPYVAWDSQSADNLQNTLTAAGVAGASNLDWLRNIGLGAALKLPLGEGQTPRDIPRWSGETTVTPSTATPGDPVVVGITFDEQGRPSVLGLPPAALAAIGNLPTLDATTMATIKALGWQKLQLTTTPNGLNVSFNDDQPLTTIAYDDASLQSLMNVLTPILGATSPQLVDTLNQIIPSLPALNLNLGIGFNGTPVETQLKSLPVGISDQGAITFAGMPIPGASLPTETLAQLSAAGIGSLGIAAASDSISLAVNGQPLPKISFTPDGLNAVASIASSVVGVAPEMITGGLDALGSAGLSTSITLPGGQAAEPPADVTFAPPAASDEPGATIRLKATIQNGQITSIGGLSADQLAALGVALPVLPANIMDTLNGLGAKEINLVNTPGNLAIKLDGKDSINLQYDEASLANAWNLAKPQLANGPLADATLQKLVEEQFLPMLPTTDLNVTITLE